MSSHPDRRDKPGRREEPPATPDAAPPEEPQTSVHEQAIQPAREDEAEDERRAG